MALPMIVSQAAETVMLFFDRLFVSFLGTEHLSACMAGGLTSFMMLTFFLGVINYVNPLTAQYLGSGRTAGCGVAGSQGMLLALCSAPAVMALAPAGRALLRASGHAPLQTTLEIEYFTILACGAILPLLRTALSSFFCGVGRTPVVMTANLTAMVANIFANYALIFGHWGFPALGMRGAAYGTLFGSAIGVLILLAVYFSGPVHAAYQTRSSLGWAGDVLRRLLRYGLPSGIEFFMNLAAFNLFVLMFHSYGTAAAAAITITFNWDLVAFLPLTGVAIAVTSLVGRYMGAGQPDLAARTARSGLRTVAGYGLAMTWLFVAHTDRLIAPFLHGAAPGDHAAVTALATLTLRIAALYLIADGVLMVYDGVLRGAGDTRWTMAVSVSLHWLMTAVCFLLIIRLRVPPVAAWSVFILLVFAIAIAFLLRYRAGHWRRIQIVEPGPAPLVVVPDNPAPPDLI